MKEGQDKGVVSIAYHLSHFISSKNKVRTGPAALSEPFHAAAELGRGHSSLSPHTPLPCTHCTCKGCSFSMLGVGTNAKEVPDLGADDFLAERGMEWGHLLP